MGLAAPLWLQTPDGLQISGRCPIVKLKLAAAPSFPCAFLNPLDTSAPIVCIASHRTAPHRGTMALRRPIWQHSPRICTISALNAPRHDAPFRCNAVVSSSSATPSRRRLASQAAASQATVQHAQPPEYLLPRRDRTALDDVLSALQTKNTDQLFDAFMAWTDILADTSSPLHDAAVRQAQHLPGPTLSELLRSFDPVASPAHDVAHGLNITQGQTQFMDVGDLVDEFGVRTRHCRLLPALQVLIDVRGDSSSNSLTPSDYEVCLRCAGAAVGHRAAKEIWNAMAKHGVQDSRTSQTWNEFIKARFITEPLYYQFDRSRVANLARHMYSNRDPLPRERIRRMDHMRLSLNALKREPWNRRREEPDEDLRRLLRRRYDFSAYKNHWVRALYYGLEMDEALLCTSIIAFARSSSLDHVTMILKSYYGIEIEAAADQPAGIHISGGVDLLSDSPLRPTVRLLDAIVEAFGAMSLIPLGMKLVDFVSRRYDVPIPAATWSNTLSWTYVCASKPFQSMRRLRDDWQDTATSADDVLQVWNVMTSEPHNVEPSFDDYDIYVKTLLKKQSFDTALDVIRHNILPYYDSLVEEYEKALLDEILQNDIALPPSSSALTTPARRRRLQAQLRKDDAHHRISSWFTRLLKSASGNRLHRVGPFARVLVPDLLAEFPEFFHPQIRYRTEQGHVQLERPEATRRFEWFREWRVTLPSKKAGFEVRDLEGADQSDFEWPRVQPMRVLEWRRRPKARLDKLGKAPADADKREWWNRLEEELLR
ncbi:hypothetical protein JDV02_003566 [Purpureocillium takamizusanense]|uniref:Uncharacterized protein n=1 Tax=Purpureocillium takamizusanense TaxID=2060973 RepID=A0A9Q8V8Z2_9HYPO|nr:uncharacterized protein JDV02_003566 [Purpureocillium takamizusanense]UNI17193.1 hypothetical protein JDV02_003566 [Purpureocillium takamizusanense]